VSEGEGEGEDDVMLVRVYEFVYACVRACVPVRVCGGG